MTYKPNWKSAPKWAQYVAQDANGVWFWHETQPQAKISGWIQQIGAYCTCEEPNPNWKETLEAKPVEDIVHDISENVTPPHSPSRNVSMR